MHSRHSERGYTTLIFLAIIVLGVALAAPGIYREKLRDINQARKKKTLEDMMVIFRATFPDATCTAKNTLFDHCGYRPISPVGVVDPSDRTRSWDFSFLVDRSVIKDSCPSLASVRAFDGNTSTPYWNGPYWNGSIINNRPIDAWGRPYRLRIVDKPSLGWVIFSTGENGVDNTEANSGIAGGDDYIYPNPPYVIPDPPSPGVCPRPSFVFRFSSRHTPNDVVEFTLGSQKMTGQFNNGNPTGKNWSGEFTNVPVGPIRIFWISMRGRGGEINVTVNANCTVTPAIIDF